MTNVFCALCEDLVEENDDSFVVTDSKIVQAFHQKCGVKIMRALGDRLVGQLGWSSGVETPPSGIYRRPFEQQTVKKAEWKQRELVERIEALEDLTQRVKNVWALWLNDARKGAINPGTFDSMRRLLGIED